MFLFCKYGIEIVIVELNLKDLYDDIILNEVFNCICKFKWFLIFIGFFVKNLIKGLRKFLFVFIVGCFYIVFY